MTKQTHFKYAVIYIDGGHRDKDNVPGTGIGIHGYFFDELKHGRISKVPVLVTPEGYKPKLTGPQLKDAEYNPVYSHGDITLDIKASGIAKEGTGIYILDGILGQKVGTNNTGEMKAFINIINESPLTADKYLLWSDSQLLVKGYNENLDKWSRNNYRKADSNEVKNRELWEDINAIREKRKSDIDLRWVKAHNGDFGNELSDRNATYGVIAGINQCEDITWIISDIHDTNYWEPEKPVPTMLRNKWLISLSDTPHEKYTVGTDKYTEYLTCDVKDDIELLGRRFGDSNFSLVWSTLEVPVFNRIIDYHTKNMWETDCIMYQSEVIHLCNIANISKPKTLWELNNIPLNCMWWEDHHNCIVSEKGELISQVLRPPMLSYRILDEQKILRRTLAEYIRRTTGKEIDRDCSEEPSLVINDVTELLYAPDHNKDGVVKGYKLTDYYDQVARSIDFEVKHPCNDRTVKITMSRNIHIPDRNTMNAMGALNPKVSIVTWHFDKRAFSYGMIIQTDEGYGIWTNPYGNMRILDDTEL